MSEAKVRLDRATKALMPLHPEIGVAGFCATDHRVVFYNLVNALVTPESHVLDFGAGRGKWVDLETGYKLSLTTLKGRCAEIVGVDVDPAVLTNPLMDRTAVIGPDGRIPLPDQSVDVIVSWAVFEHLPDPAASARELDRVLKPGGWICAWTPNRWGYVGIGARLVPNALHAKVLKRLNAAGGREDHDVFPTVYRLNTRAAVQRAFPNYRHHSYIHTGAPSYHGGRTWLAWLIAFYGKVMPRAMGQMLHVFIQKPE